MKSSVSARLNADILEEKYAQWSKDPQSVEATWAAFFEGFELGTVQPPKKPGSNPLIHRRVGQKVSRDLPSNEVAVGEIIVERVHHPVAPRINRPRVIFEQAVCVPVTRNVKPLLRHALAECS